MIVDLHTHTTCSDGKLSPSELVALAEQNNVELLAITDHDTVQGIPEAQEHATRVKIISGVEFSSVWNGRNIHVVGLNIDIHNQTLQDAVKSQGLARKLRAETIASRLEKVGIEKPLIGAKAFATGDVIARPHFAEYLIDKGYVSNFNQAFKRYLGSGKVGDVKCHWPEMYEVVDWIVQAGGIPVLAHPDKYDFTRTKLYVLIEAFVAAGGLALEVVSGKQLPNVTDKLKRAAKEFQLLASTGSDFHLPNVHWQAVGKQPLLPKDCEPVWQHF